MNHPYHTDISNWRNNPQSRWSFQNVCELIPTQVIETSGGAAFSRDENDLSSLNFSSPFGVCNLPQLLEKSYSDTLVVLHHGKIAYEWRAPHFESTKPHIVFSISKSLTALLAGILQQQGIVDCEANVSRYLPGVKNGVYGSCTVRHLLDMTVALDFEENYTDQNSEYMQYRRATAWNPVDRNNPGPGLEEFLYSLFKSGDEHGNAFLYRSPNSDLLGLLLERAAGEPLANLFSKLLWQPMGATMDGYISVDRLKAPRGAGGICISVEDLARIGQLFLNGGESGGNQVVPQAWIEDTCNNGDQGAWDRGNYKEKLPDYKYRNQWYQMQDEDRSICARGIHGQLLYINPVRSVVIVRMASHPDPLNDPVTSAVMSAFDLIAKSLA